MSLEDCHVANARVYLNLVNLNICNHAESVMVLEENLDSEHDEDRIATLEFELEQLYGKGLLLWKKFEIALQEWETAKEALKEKAN